MMSQFLSFIIPLYNCEKYIRRCLDSIYCGCLTDDEFETIVINDGSSDGGKAIVEEYALEHKNLSLRSFSNAGASTARNRGLELAKGDYVWFVDADDIIYQDAIPYIKEIVKSKTDIDVFSFNYKIANRTGISECNSHIEPKVISSIEYLIKRYPMYLWNKIYRRGLLKDFRFLDGTRNTEDWLFNMQVLTQAKNIYCIDKYGYEYNTTNTNSTLSNRQLDSLIKNSNDTLNVHKTLLNYIGGLNNEVFKSEITKHLNYGVCGHLYSLFRDIMPTDYISKIINEYRNIGLYPISLPYYNLKGNLFRLLANNKSVFIVSIRIMDSLNINSKNKCLI